MAARRRPECRDTPCPGPAWLANGRAARLQCQLTRLVDGRVEGGYTDAFEVICPSCGDHPGLDYSEVSRWLQCLRGPRAIKEGLAVYIEHIGDCPRLSLTGWGARASPQPVSAGLPQTNPQPPSLTRAFR